MVTVSFRSLQVQEVIRRQCIVHQYSLDTEE